MKFQRIMTKVLLFLLIPTVSFAAPIFEGYYKIAIADVPIGYLIQRYDIEQSSKTLTSTYYMYTKSNNETTIESLQAKASTKLEPLSYKYTFLEGKKTKVIDAIVKKNKLILNIVEDGKAKTKEVTLSNNTFFSTYLSHLMLRSEKGFQVGNKFTYEAVAEEDGSMGRGEAFIKEQVEHQGMDAFRVLNTYKGQQFVNWVNVKGESLKTLLPTINLTSELMKDPQAAHKGMEFNESSIKLIFGNIPEGKTNMLHKK